MSWVCSLCSSNNLDTNATCEICCEPRPAPTESPRTTAVRTLTQTRAERECAYADVTVSEEYNVIGENAFTGRTDLYTIRIHSGVKKIMKGAFDGCTNLYGVYVDGRLSSIGSRAFANCKYLSPERRPAADIVARDAFDGCSGTPIGIPDRSVGTRPPEKKAAGTATRSTGSGALPRTTGSASSGPVARTSGTDLTKAVKKAPTPPPPPKPSYTPPPSPIKRLGAAVSVSKAYDVFSVVSEKFSLCFMIAVAAFVGIFMIADWGLVATREAWQTAGGLTAVLCVGMLVHRLYTESRYVEIGATLSLMTVLSLLVWFFGGRDTVITSIIAVGLVVLSAVTSYLAFEDVEEECGWWILALFAMNVLNFILVLVCFGQYAPVDLWQVLVAEAIVLFACVFAHNVIDLGEHVYLLGMSFGGLLLTALIVFCFGSYLSDLATVLSLGFIIINAVGAYKAFDDYESGYGTGCVILGSLEALLFLITCFSIA